MSNVIQFLETMGRDAAFSRLSTPEYAESVARLELDHELRDALARKDVSALKRLLGLSDTLMMLLFREGEDAPQQDDHQQDGDTPEQENSRLRSVVNG